MSKGTIIDFVGGSFQDKLRSLSNQLCENLYPEVIGAKGNYTNMILRSIEGTTSACVFNETDTIGCRGLYYSSTGPAPDFNPQLYGVFNKTVYRIDSSFNKYPIGTVGNNSSVVKFSETGGPDSQLCVVDGYNLYVCPLSASNETLAFTTITLPPAAGTDQPILPSQITWIDGRIVLNSTNTNQYYYTEPYTLNNVTSAFAFNTAEASSDKINAITTFAGNLWVFGPRSYEVWQSQNELNFPFGRITGAQAEIGCNASESVVTIGNSLFWLGSSRAGHNGIFVATGPNSIDRISTPQIEAEINAYADTQDAIGQTWSRNGHTFYSITFPRGDKTFVYDLSTELWHNRATRDKFMNINHMWQPQYATFAYGKIFMGSYNSQHLIYFDDNKHKEFDGRPIVRTRISPVFIDNFSPAVVNEFELEIGVGLTKILNGEGSDPQVMLQISLDGGYTWSNEKWKSMGKTGQYYRRVKWFNGLGIGRLIVIKTVISDDVDVTITSAKIRLTPTNQF